MLGVLNFLYAILAHMVMDTTLHQIDTFHPHRSPPQWVANPLKYFVATHFELHEHLRVTEITSVNEWNHIDN